MLDFIKRIFSSDFMPHGHCYAWDPGIVWLHVISDSLIALAYYSIPLMLVYFVGKRKDMPYPWMFLMFGGFIVACGTTHLVEVWTVWHGTYRFAGAVKAVTALLSIGTAILLVKITPEAMALQSPTRLAKLNTEMEREIAERHKAESALRRSQEDLELRVRERTEELARANAALQAEIAERKRAENQVRQLNTNLERRVVELQTLFDVLPIGIGIAQDPACRHIQVNQAFARMLGLPPESNASKSAPADEIPTNFRVLYHGAELKPDELPMQRAASKRELIRDFEEEIRSENGSTQYVLAYAAPLFDENKSVRGSVGAFVDITDRKKTEERIRDSLKEKETLLQEVHHRVKNNMQVISSLLQLQAGYVHDPAAREMFRESQDRIKSMALIHEKLYQSNDLTQVQFSEYLNTLVEMLARSYGSRARQLHLKVNAATTTLTVSTAIPVGLIVNELVSNALKHAFPHGRSGDVTIEFSGDSEAGFRLEVRDNGVGVGPDFAPERSNSLGLRLVRILADQVNAVVKFANAGGLQVTLTFRELK